MLAEKKKDALLNGLGIILLVVVGLNILLNIVNEGKYYRILWFCDVAAIVAGTGILLRKPLFVNGVLITAVIAQVPWIFDFISTVLGFGSFGRTRIILEMSSQPGLVTSILLHSLLIPFTVWATIKLGFSGRRAFVVALFFVILLPLSYFLTPPQENINCVFYSCDVSFSEYRPVYSGEYAGMVYLLNVVLFWLALLVLTFPVHCWIFRCAGKPENK